jgi:lipopolysaccharide/colanic/teichoic acid biosynthesis glycosyltransferase
VSLLGSVPLLRPSSVETGLRWQAIGALERAVAFVLFMASLPMLLVCAGVIRVRSGRTPWIAHKRVGLRGNTLWMWKLRTMWDDKPASGGWIEYIEDHQGPLQKAADDPRVSCAFARFLRRHSIDELPQLWHVVMGEMSLVGPRPMTSRELDRYYGEDAGEILEVKPGIAGLWQTSGRNRLTYSERRRLDLKLVRERSLTMYLAILLRTVPEVFHGENSW